MRLHHDIWWSCQAQGCFAELKVEVHQNQTASHENQNIFIATCLQPFANHCINVIVML